MSKQLQSNFKEMLHLRLFNFVIIYLLHNKHLDALADLRPKAFSTCQPLCDAEKIRNSLILFIKVLQ